MANENPKDVKGAKKEPVVRQRIEKFIDEEGEKIRQETDRIQSPIIAKARLEYKNRLVEFIDEEREKLRLEVEKEAADKIRRAESEANSIITQAQAQKQEIIDAGEKEALAKTDQMIEQVKRQVEVIKESAIAEGQKEVDAIIAEAKQNAEKLTSEAMESARMAAEAESAKILMEAHENASNEAATYISNSWRQAQDMIDAAEVAYNVVREQLRQCLQRISEADRTMALALADREIKYNNSSETIDLKKD